jgi:hypothetical protein
MSETSSRVRLIFEGSEHGVVAAATKSAAALKLLNNQNTTVGKTFKAADEQATKFIGTLTKTAAVTSLVAAGGGLIGQTFAGALPIMTALGVASLTVKLGMDGIKKAAEGAKKPFDDLKKAVSGTFEKDLKGPVRDVAGLLPKLTSGFQGVAASISGAAGQITGFAASARGVAVLQDVLKGTADFIAGLGPQLATFLDGFLSAIASAKDQMRGLGDAFGSIFGSLGDVLRTLANDDVGTFAKAIAGFSATLTGLGRVIGSVIDVAIRLGAAFGDSFGVVLNGLADGIGKASPGLVDLGSALGDLLRAAAPLLPTIGELAGQFAHALADGIRAVIPYVQAFADWAKNNIGTVKGIAEAIVALALGVKALSIFTSVVGWVDGVVGAFGRFKGSAATAEVATSRLGGAMGLLKGVAVAAALGAVAEGMDRVNISAAGGADKLTGVQENLHDITGAAHELLSGDFGRIGSEFGAQMDETVRHIQAGQSAFGQFLGYIKRQFAEKLPPLTFDVNTGPARAQVDGFIGAVNKNSPTVNINGNTNGAAFALREILAEIAAGKSQVTIDGQSIPAQDALKFVTGLINNSNPEVSINGNPQQAGDALAGFLKSAQGSTATAQLNADPAKALETVGGWTRFTEGTTGMAQMNANPVQANDVVSTWKSVTAATTGLAHLNAEPGQANAAVAGWKGSANATTGTSHLNAERGQANSTTSGWLGDANRSSATAHLNAEDSGARGTLGGLLRDWGNRVLTWTVNIAHGLGFASGGPVFGAASGGAIHGPGTGTSDTAGLFRLSNGEHVLTAREVQAAGGHAAIFRMRRELMGRPVPQLASRGRVASGGGITSSGSLSLPTPQVSVAVHIGSQEITDIVRTEISHSNRATRRTVLAGAGTTF